jgi:DNA-binding NtrC family response regulator
MAVILVVEDEIFTCDIAGAFIEDFGHEAHCANDVNTAHTIIRSTQHFDVLFTDIRLQDAIDGGYLVAWEAVKHRPAIKVLYTSGSNLNDEMKNNFVDEAHFLQKPYSVEQLGASLARLLALPG